MDPAQRSRLLAAKLDAIVTTRQGPGDRTGGSFPSGATLLEGDAAWVLLDEVGPRSLGGVVLWAARQGVASVDLVIEAGTATAVLLGDLARRASWFERPVQVVTVGRDHIWTTVEPTPAPPVLLPPSGVEELVGVLAEHGCEVVTEQGIVRGERLGLEVARIEEHPDGFRLESGVGRFDREVGAMMRADLTAADSLAAVLAIVDAHRFPGAPPHPVRDLARERWVRASIVADPASIGLQSLRPVETTEPRPNLRDPHPAMAVGDGPDGTVVVACTMGVDVDLLALAEDVRRREAPDAPLLVVHPEASPLLPSALAAGEWLARPPSVVASPAPWIP